MISIERFIFTIRINNIQRAFEIATDRAGEYLLIRIILLTAGDTFQQILQILPQSFFAESRALAISLA